MSSTALTEYEIPVFPLHAVLFPDGLLNLRVFEARYLDLVSDCLRHKRTFGVVALRRGKEVRDGQKGIELEGVGCEAEILDVDSAREGVLKVRCRGRRRFVVNDTRERENGLWMASVSWIEPDLVVLPSVEMVETVKALANAIVTLRANGNLPVLEPYCFTDAAWVANRWSELLPISTAARHQLMAMTDPGARLQLVDQFLRSRGIVTS